MLMNDRQIKKYATLHGMIGDFVEDLVRVSEKTGESVISYGTSSFGYDARVADEWAIFRRPEQVGKDAFVDPKNFDPELVERISGAGYIILPPNSFALARTVEGFNIPRHTLSICLGKSTYARCGVIVNVTPLEPGWKGHVTLEFSNSTTLPVKIYAGEGACQFIFLTGEDPDVSYADRAGKYQGQIGVTLPKV